VGANKGIWKDSWREHVSAGRSERPREPGVESSPYAGTNADPGKQRVAEFVLGLLRHHLKPAVSTLATVMYAPGRYGEKQIKAAMYIIDKSVELDDKTADAFTEKERGNIAKAVDMLDAKAEYERRLKSGEFDLS